MGKLLILKQEWLSEELSCLPVISLAAFAQERTDCNLIHAIGEEAFEHSRVMDHLEYLTDRYGHVCAFLAFENACPRMWPFALFPGRLRHFAECFAWAAAIGLFQHARVMVLPVPGVFCLGPKTRESLKGEVEND